MEGLEAGLQSQEPPNAEPVSSSATSSFSLLPVTVVLHQASSTKPDQLTGGLFEFGGATVQVKAPVVIDVVP